MSRNGQRKKNKNVILIIIIVVVIGLFLLSRTRQITRLEPQRVVTRP
jgi:flagellar basal body-associated protein FliL